ncbi:MAG: type II toxin-antitoxin system PemK/MazF family toxin [Proteobacteria bacterium]|nr:type II toxin-antitoxin system PemK/MazF family toxin [Pseudomonadota bacterium]
MKRGEVYWVKEQSDTSGSEIKKKRPWIIVGNNSINRARKTIVSVPLSTSAPESLPIAPKVGINGQLIVAVCDQIRAIEKSKFENSICILSNQDMNLIEEGLKLILALQ